MFYYTAFVSVLAYGWVFYCLYDNVITKLEAGLTCGFLLLFIILSYGLDRIVFFCCPRKV